MRILFGISVLVIGMSQCNSVHAAPPVKAVKASTANTRLKQQQVSKSLLAKLKAQALNEARAELATENEARERAKLEALQELEAGTNDTGEPRPESATTNLTNGE